MIKYIKIIQKEQNIQILKSPYQVVSDLVRNNKLINKQIQSFVSSTQYVNTDFEYESKKSFQINYYSLDWFYIFYI